MKTFYKNIKALIQGVDTGTWHAMLVLVSFQVILVALFYATSVGLTSLRNAHTQTANLIGENQLKSQLISRMSDIMRERVWHIYRLLGETDPFEVEQQWEQFAFYAAEFMQARETLYSQILSESELAQLNTNNPRINLSQRLTADMLELLREGRHEEAEQRVNAVFAASEEVLADLSAMRTALEKNIRHQVSDMAQQSLYEAHQQVVLMGGFAVIVSIGIISLVIYRIITRENALTEALNALREGNELLETRVAERTADLQSARDAALEASQTKSRFLANMSHELRTPLNAIIGYSDMLREDCQDMEPEEVVTDLDKINTSGRHLLELINDILDISKIEAGKLQIDLEYFNLRSLVQDVMDTMQPLIEKNRNTFQLQYQVQAEDMYADPMRVRQILLNLLSNAAKFTHQGQVTLEVLQLQAENRQWLIFSVTDTGIGISKEHQTKLFKPFSQVDASTTRKYGGTGLGLVISLRFCQLMGGNITVESEPGRGCRCVVRLPLLVTVQPEINPESSSSLPARDETVTLKLEKRV